MKIHRLDRLLTVLITVGLLPIGALVLASCKPCPAAITVAYADTDCGFGPLAEKQCEAGGPKKPGDPKEGGVNARGSGSGRTTSPCPPTAKGKGGSKKGEKDSKKKNMKLFGANGAKVPWSKPVANGSAGGRPWRIDLENPDPGYRKGSLHVQLDNRLGGTRWEYAGKGQFKTEDGTKLPNAVQKDIDRRAEDDIRNALSRYLKEPW